jgi:hypothetical protein
MQTFLDARAVAQDITAIARHKLTDRLRHRGRWKELPIDGDQLGGRNSKKRERLFAGRIAMPLELFRSAIAERKQLICNDHRTDPIKRSAYPFCQDEWNEVGRYESQRQSVPLYGAL